MKLHKALLVIVLVLLVCACVISAQDQNTPPTPSAPRPVTFPAPVEQTFGNGLRVIVVERHEIPLVTVSFVVKNGGEVDPPGLGGVADLTANLLTKGTTTKNATRIAHDVEALGGQLEAEGHWDASTVSVDMMADKVGPAISILADVVRRPLFRRAELERLRQQYLDNLTVELDDPSSIARFVGAKVLYGDTAYGHPIAGTVESLQRISRNDILRMHRRFYRPDNAILVIGGDIKSDTAFSLARRYFGDWVKPTTRLPAAKGNGNPKATARVVVIDKPDADQSAVFTVRLGIERKSPEYFSGLVANSVLGGYSGRLNQEIRIKRGLSYGASSMLDARRGVGPFVEAAQTKNESAVEVATLLMSGVPSLNTSPPVEAELATRKAYLIGEFSRSLETLTGLVSSISSLALYGLKLEEINRFVANVQAITAMDLQRFAMSMSGPNSVSIIIVGKAEASVPALKKRYDNVEVIPLEKLDLNSLSLRKK